MGGIMGGSKPAPQVQQTAPVIVDNSEQVRNEEQKRKKRYGAAAQFLSGNASTGDANTGKTTLGA